MHEFEIKRILLSEQIDLKNEIKHKNVVVKL